MWSQPGLAWRMAFHPVDHTEALARQEDSLLRRRDGTEIRYKSVIVASILAWEAFVAESILPVCEGEVVVRPWVVYFGNKVDAAKVRLLLAEHIRMVQSLEDFWLEGGTVRR